jgi:hypothetical protein
MSVIAIPQQFKALILIFIPLKGNKVGKEIELLKSQVAENEIRLI